MTSSMWMQIPPPQAPGAGDVNSLGLSFLMWKVGTRLPSSWSQHELNELAQCLAHPRGPINSCIATCHQYRSADKLRLAEGMAPT